MAWSCLRYSFFPQRHPWSDVEVECGVARPSTERNRWNRLRVAGGRKKKQKTKTIPGLEELAMMVQKNCLIKEKV